MLAVMAVCGDDGWDFGVVTILAWSSVASCLRRSGDKNEDKLGPVMKDMVSTGQGKGQYAM